MAAYAIFLGEEKFHGISSIAMPPIKPAKLGKNGNAIEIKNAKHPKKTLKTILSDLGQGLFFMLVYLDSRLSNTGIA
ncbi:hypothetical protein Lal_00004902 [Lupinus albus]|nr:hypothetical protein Lal_00004902 [Lupinus albus]